MEKTIRIIKLIWWCIVVAPLGFITAYNVYRQEINTGLPPLVNLLPNWHWAIWFSVFLIAIIIALIYEIYRKPNSDAGKSSSAQSEKQSGGVTGNINNSSIHQGDIYHLPDEKILPNVEIKEPRVRSGRFNFYLTNRYGEIFDDPDPIKATFFEVVFSNNPVKRAAESTSRNVLAEITYYTSNNLEIGSITGGWMDLKSLKISRTVHIPFNGDSRVLLLALRFLDEPSLFMHGMETNPDYFGNRDRDFRYRLSEKEPKDIKIKIHLIGKNLDKEYNLILHYGGKDGASRIESL